MSRSGVVAWLGVEVRLPRIGGQKLPACRRCYGVEPHVPVISCETTYIFLRIHDPMCDFEAWIRPVYDAYHAELFKYSNVLVGVA